MKSTIIQGLYKAAFVAKWVATASKNLQKVLVKNLEE